jgi:tRNA (guanine-N7-)-methyltransferase
VSAATTADPRKLYLEVPALPLTGPIDIDRLTGGQGPIELEIGFGRARFLLDRAAANPQTSFLGLETRRKWVYRAAKRSGARELENVTVRLGDARKALARIEPPARLSCVFVNFPDPWWKARHQKRLVLTEDVLHQITRLLRDRGQLFLQTDVEFRAEGYRQLLAAIAELEPMGQGGRVADNPFGARSSREIRCADLGLPVQRLLYARRSR